MPQSIPRTGQWLRSVVQGYFNYHAVPGNTDSLAVFRDRVILSWRTILIHRAIGDGTDFGNTGAGIAKGPGQFNFDVTVQKLTKLNERQNILFRAEFFNLFNHPQFEDPGGTFTVPVTPALPDVNGGPGVFGRIIATSVSPRVIQLGLKYTF